MKRDSTLRVDRDWMDTNPLEVRASLGVAVFHCDISSFLLYIALHGIHETGPLTQNES